MHASFCIIVPDGAKRAIEVASNNYATDANGAVRELIEEFPESSSIDGYLHYVLNGSDEVTI